MYTHDLRLLAGAKPEKLPNLIVLIQIIIQIPKLTIEIYMRTKIAQILFLVKQILMFLPSQKMLN